MCLVEVPAYYYFWALIIGHLIKGSRFIDGRLMEVQRRLVVLSFDGLVSQLTCLSANQSTNANHDIKILRPYIPGRRRS